MTVGERIKACRKEAGLTLKQMSAFIGISVSFLSDIENGRSKPSLKRLEKIAEKLQTSVSWLMGENGDVKEASGTYKASEWGPVLLTLMSSSSFSEVMNYLRDFQEWDEGDQKELLGYLRAKKLSREGRKRGES